MKILITGSTGMVGKNLLESELVKNHQLLTPTSRVLNLKEFSAVSEYLNNHKPEFIIHCAGTVGGIQANIKEPTRFFIENLEMGKNLIWSAQQVGIKKLLNLGTSCMYPKDFERPLKETDMLTGQLEPTNEGYALAKCAVAKLCEYIAKENPQYHYKTIIPCNLYGRHDSFQPEKSHMIPAVIRKVHEAVAKGDSVVEIWGDGSARREFLYTGDLADFICTFVDRFEQLDQLTNVGLGFDYTILEYYQAISEVIGFSGDFSFNTDKPVGMKRKLVDVTKATNLGWKAKTSLKEGIEKSYQFFKENYCA